MGRVLGVASGAGGFLTALATTGWLGGLVLIGIVLVVTIATCWIVDDAGRARRSALLIKTWRESGRAASKTSSARSSRRP